jgi:hypothetical protein
MDVEGSGYGFCWEATRCFSDVTLKNHQTLFTITSVRAEILKAIPENETAEPNRDLLSPTFPPLFQYRLHVIPLVPSPNFYITFVSSDGIRTPRSSTLSRSLSEQYCIKNKRLYKKKIPLSATNTVSSGSLRIVLDPVSNLHCVSYFASSKTSNYIILFLEATNFMFRSICMTVNSK